MVEELKTMYSWGEKSWHGLGVVVGEAPLPRKI